MVLRKPFKAVHTARNGDLRAKPAGMSLFQFVADTPDGTCFSVHLIKEAPRFIGFDIHTKTIPRRRPILIATVRKALSTSSIRRGFRRSEMKTWSSNGAWERRCSR